MTTRDSEDQFYAMEGHTGGAFRYHTERMRIFNETHPDTVKKEVTSSPASISQESAGTCRVALTISETGGSATPTGNEDWLSVVPMWKMALHRFSTN